MKKLIAFLTIFLLCTTSYAGRIFDGSNDRQLSAVSNKFNITSGNATWYFVIKPKTLGESSFGRIFNYSTNDSTTGYTIAVQATNTIAISPLGGTSVAAPSNSITLGAWNIVVIRKTGTTYEIFVNGVLVVTGVGTNPASAAGATLRVGIRNNLQREFDGIIDEIAIWNTAISNNSVNILSFSKVKGIPQQVETANLLDYWSLDELMDYVSRDATAIDNHGTVNLTSSGGPSGKASEILSYQ